MRLSFLSIVPSFVLPLGATVVDDTDSSWTYNPTSSWGAISAAAPCSVCNTQPNSSKTMNSTWHDLSKGGSARLSFSGTSVIVYAICPKGIYRSNFTFFMDNEPAGRFLAPEGGCKDYVYNQVIYRRTGLQNSNHVFQVNNWIAPGAEYSTSDLVIDYAVVTSNSSDESSHGSPANSPIQPPKDSGRPSSQSTVEQMTPPPPFPSLGSQLPQETGVPDSVPMRSVSVVIASGLCVSAIVALL